MLTHNQPTFNKISVFLIKIIIIFELIFSEYVHAQNAPSSQVEILSYQNFSPTANSPAIVSIDLNFNALKSLAPGEEVLFLAPNGKKYIYIFDQITYSNSGSLRWIGHLKQAPILRSIITWGNGGFGNIFTPDGEFVIKTINGVTQLTDISLQPRRDLEGSDDFLVHENHASELEINELKIDDSEIQSDMTSNSSIDLLALYTPEFVSQYGADMVRTRIEHLVGLANQAFIDSNIYITVNLVGVAQVSYPASKKMSTALEDMRKGTVVELSGVSALRKKYGADLVTLIRPDNLNTDPTTCGVGYVNGSNGSSFAATSGFSVVEDGNGCSEYTLAHELGHNMGALHDRVNDTSGLKPFYPYAYGYGVSGTFGTVMSYLKPRIGIFSNPNKLCPGGLPCGVSESDITNGANNALAINNKREAIASFYPPTPVGDIPSTFAFNTIQGASQGSAVYSDIVSISGITGQVDISIQSGEYSIDGGPFTSSAGKVSNGQSVQVKLTSSATAYATSTAYLTIGQVIRAFRAVTAGSHTTPVTPKLAGGYDHSLALRSDGTVWSWGGNSKGQLGDGTIISRKSPIQISNLDKVVNISASQNYSLALKQDGTVWGWGDNTSGQLADATKQNSLVPKKLNIANIVSVSAGSYRSLALDKDGAVWSWGNINNTPVKVNLSTNAIAIAAGSFHSVALLSDGTVWAWGSNLNGQIGNSSVSTSGNYASQPAKVTGPSNIQSIISGSNHSFAVSSNGDVWAWGDNQYGQLGIGTKINVTNPVKATNLSGFTAIYVDGANHAIALKSDGSLYGWGYNISGQLGDGTKIDKPTAVPISIGLNILSLALGKYHSMSLMKDGSVLTWGDNWAGQLGGITYSSNLLSPTQVISRDWRIGDMDNFAAGFALESPTTTEVGQTFTTQPIVVSGLNTSAPISILGGTYSINGGAFTNGAGFVSNGQTVIVKSVVPSIVGQLQTVTLDIGGVSSSLTIQAKQTVSKTTVPSQPTLATAIAGNLSATVSFTAPINNGGASITGYSVISSPGGKTASGLASPITVTGLTNGTPYTFTVTAANSAGAGAASSPSNSVTPTSLTNMISLVSGWNLIGNSYNVALDVTSLLSDPANVTTVWKWLPSSTKWAFYAPTLPSQALADYVKNKGYEVLSTVVGGEGFWVNAKQAFELQVPNGVQVLSTDFQSGGAKQLNSGWSLIAIGDNKEPSSFNSSLSLTPPSGGKVASNVTTLWAWDADTSKWYFYAPSLEASGGLINYNNSKGYLDFSSNQKKLAPGVGFWVNSP
jgi:alpha-tubulin suppressor-like RCC1 family protein